MGEDDEVPEPTPELAALLGQLSEGLLATAQLIEQYIVAASGYRQKCLDAGFSAEASEAMAVEYHRVLMRSMN